MPSARTINGYMAGQCRPLGEHFALLPRLTLSFLMGKSRESRSLAIGMFESRSLRRKATFAGLAPLSGRGPDYPSTSKKKKVHFSPADGSMGRNLRKKVRQEDVES
jgi:hypothetical protein